ncbi:MAG: SDR family oxidoreductase [Gammaproteobacteria bacterium]|nr:SDR family oxidoreductase [Gammaproteobacteria bacterium]
MNASKTSLLTTLWLMAMFVAADVHAGAHDRQPGADELLVDPTKRTGITGTVLITGANRGIGLAMARNYAERGWRVIATARKPNKAAELNELAGRNKKVSVERLDVLDPAQIDALATKYQGEPIDVLFNNAAILGDPNGQVLGQYDHELFKRVLDTNTVGPLRMAEAFLGHVAASEQKKIVGMTSGQGSIELMGRTPRFQFYNASKSALHMTMRAVGSQAKDRGITVVLVSPGAVDTGLMDLALQGREYPGQLLTPEQSAEAVINVVDQYSFDMSGTFISHQGAELPW